MPTKLTTRTKRMNSHSLFVFVVAFVIIVIAGGADL
jgi:hypothetical protein